MKFRGICGFYCLLFLTLTTNAEISDEEQDTILKIREIFLERNETYDSEENIFNANWINKTGDEILINWVQYFENDIQKIVNALEKSLEWRKSNNLENAKNWSPPQYILDNFPWKITGYTDEGQAVLYMPVGLWDMRSAIASGYRMDLIKHMILMIENVLASMKERNEKLGLKPAGNVVLVADLNGINFNQVSSIRVLGTASTGILQINYPFLHSHCFGVRVPRIAAILVEMVKQVLTSKTFERISIYDHNSHNWLPILQKIIPPQSFPQELLEDL